MKGYLFAFSETGTEGIWWAVQERDKGYDGLHILEEGEHLTVFKENGEVFWEGVIDYDREIGKKPLPFNPQYFQQQVLGVWCHGIQRGEVPEFWAGMFFGEYEAEVK